MRTDHWSKRTIDFILPYFEQAERSVQIATGFFSIQGYDLVRAALAGKWVQLLVGFDEKSRERLREKLIDDIMRHLSQWDAVNRRAAVIDLVNKIRDRQFQIIERKEENDIIEARTRSRDHAKVFIFDQAKVIVGSINLSRSGLLYNAEGGTIQDQPDRVGFFVERFEKFWNDEKTYDLTQALLQALLDWLRLRPPFDVYLKTIQVLIHEEELEAPRESYKMPVNYQLVVIARVLRQLREYRGAMLVASTGLGKTVMGTHVALRLAREGKILNFLLFAPLQVHPDWKRAFKSAGLSCELFTRELLDRPNGRPGPKTMELEDALEQIDEKYLIIVDESQYFRNKLRAKDGRNRHSFQRLMEVVGKKKAHVLLLTATPFSKEIADLNNQLLLLPHTAEKKFMKPDGQFVLPGMIDDQIAPEAWRVLEKPDYFEQFIELPVSTVISTSQVAKDFATSTDRGEYILFGEEKKWIPKIGVTKVKVPVLMEAEIVKALNKHIFRHKKKAFKHRDTWRISTSTIQKEAEIAWTSSPAALKEVVERTITDDYKVQFIYSEDKRGEVLGPIRDQLHNMKTNEDNKFMQLVSFLRKFRTEERKVILFTERLSTALYLERSLAVQLPFLRVANTIKEVRGKPELKDFGKEVLKLIKGFAPVANADKISSREKIKPYDLFISTDAYSTGVNLQDASVVINYDLAWTPDVIIQRAGRVLRFWPEPRRVDFIIFVGDFKLSPTAKKNTSIVENRLDRLTRRSQHAQKFSEIPILPKGDSTNIESLGVLSSIKIEYLGLADATQIEEFSGVSPFLKHVAILQENQDYAAGIPNDISSAMVYDGSRPLLYLLLFYADEPVIVLYDPEKDAIETRKEDALLNLIQCRLETPVAEVDLDEIEGMAQRARTLWMNKHQINKEQEIQRICALYLAPKAGKIGLENLLLKRVEDKS